MIEPASGHDMVRSNGDVKNPCSTEYSGNSVNPESDANAEEVRIVFEPRSPASIFPGAGGCAVKAERQNTMIVVDIVSTRNMQ
jgi:hypothetical protein